jgi:hypothetical protein
MSVTPQTTPQRTVFRLDRKAPPATVARQGQAQRPGYPPDALRARVRSQQGRPTAHVLRMLADCFTALGGCLPVAIVDELAGGITAERAIELG